MASLLMVKTKRKQSSPDASTEHLDYQGHHERKPVSRTMSLWSNQRRGSVAEADISNNNYFQTKDQNDNDISKALEILRMQRRQSLAHADYHPPTGEKDMMVPRALEILKKMHSTSHPNVSSSAPATYNLADYEPGHVRVKRRQTTGNFFMDHLDHHGELGHREMKPLPKALEKLKLQRRGSTPAVVFRSGHIDEAGQSDMAHLPNTLNKPRSRSGSITEALLSHAGHLEVRGCSDTKALPKGLEMPQKHRRGSITEALAYQFGSLDVGGSRDGKPLPKAIQLLRKERRGSIADALLAYSKNHDVSGQHNTHPHTPLAKDVEVLRRPRRQSSPGALLEHTYYYSDEDGDEVKPVPKMVSMVRQPRRQSSFDSSDNSNNYYGAAELDHPMRYSSKLMNSIWGHYNENSVHNFKSLQCAGVSFSCPVAAEQGHQHGHRLAGSPAPTRRGKLQQRLGELGEAVAINFMDNLNQYV